MLTFTQAGNRLHEATLRIQAERELSYQEAFKIACDQDCEASLYYFETPQIRRKYLKPSEEVEKGKKIRQKEWQMASDKLARLANERVAGGLAKDFAEGFQQARRLHPDLAETYDKKRGE